MISLVIKRFKGIIFLLLLSLTIGLTLAIPAQAQNCTDASDCGGCDTSAGYYPECNDVRQQCVAWDSNNICISWQNISGSGTCGCTYQTPGNQTTCYECNNNGGSFCTSYSIDKNQTCTTDCSGCPGGGGGGSSCNPGSGCYPLCAPLSNTYSTPTANGGTCSVTITHYGWDADGSLGGYKDEGSSTTSHQVGVNDSDQSCKSNDNLTFVNSWSPNNSGPNLKVSSEIVFQDSGNWLGSGWGLQSSGCTINDCSTTSLVRNPAVQKAGTNSQDFTTLSSSTTYQLRYCGDGICSCGETAASCPADCSSPTTHLYIDPAPPGTSGDSVSGKTAATSTGTPVTLTATGTISCSTYITDPPNSSGGLRGCFVVPGSYTCNGGNPKDGLPCWWQWSCISSSTTGTYPVTFNSTQSSSCFSASNLNITLPAPTVTAVDNGCPVQQGQGQISLSWNLISGAVDYEIYRYSSDGGLAAGPFVTTFTSWTDTNVPLNHHYYYTIQAGQGTTLGLPGTSNTVWAGWEGSGCDTTKPTVSLNSLGTCYTSAGWPGTFSGIATDASPGSGVKFVKVWINPPTTSATCSASSGTCWVSYPPFLPVGVYVYPPNSYLFAASFPFPGSGQFTMSTQSFDWANNSSDVKSYPFSTIISPNPSCPKPFFQTYNGDVHANSNSGGGIKVNGN